MDELRRAAREIRGAALEPLSPKELFESTEGILTVRVEGGTVAAHVARFLQNVIEEGQKTYEIVDQAVQTVSREAGGVPLSRKDVRTVLLRQIRKSWGDDPADANFWANLLTDPSHLF